MGVSGGVAIKSSDGARKQVTGSSHSPAKRSLLVNTTTRPLDVVAVVMRKSKSMSGGITH